MSGKLQNRRKMQKRVKSDAIKTKLECQNKEVATNVCESGENSFKRRPFLKNLEPIL